MLHIYLARHGQDEDNAAGILNGRRDKSLTEIGINQAETVAHKIAEASLQFDAIYTSPLLRTRQTADIIAKKIHGPTPTALEELIERDFGCMSGKLQSTITEACAPDIIITPTIVYFLNPEGAETFPDLLKRAQGLLDRMHTLHTHGSVLLVTHGDFGKMIYAQYYQLPWQDVLTQFHFGNSELLLLSPDSPANQAHVFEIQQHNS
ncbi:MAG: histidine phosphatase family protein [Candidatus Doudnabacteria bacterium]|nr:histidine phosphatase family protein [Candidatus Doudnabacteria bacterium]